MRLIGEESDILIARVSESSRVYRAVAIWTLAACGFVVCESVCARDSLLPHRQQAATGGVIIIFLSSYLRVFLDR